MSDVKAQQVSFHPQLSSGSPVAAVCSRGDLETKDPLATGCFDTKVTSYDMALRMQVDAVAGPTTEVQLASPRAHDSWEGLCASHSVADRADSLQSNYQ